MLTTLDRARIAAGEHVCLLSIAEEWAQQKCERNEISHLQYPQHVEYLAGEMRHAVGNGKIPVFDSIRGTERPFRETDMATVDGGWVRLLPNSVNLWLASQKLSLIQAGESSAAVTEKRGSVHALSEQQELDVCNSYKNKESVNSIAIRFGVTRRTIDRILGRAGLKVSKGSK